MNILLDYFFPITSIEPTPQASTAFLKQALVVGKPKDGGVTAGVIHLLTTAASASTYFGTNAAAEVSELFAAGMSRVYVIAMNDLDLATVLAGHESDFYTVIISSDFVAADVTATKATATITISSYANLVSGTPDVITVGGVAFTAQSGAATLGAATFQAATNNNSTAASLAAQINAHAVASLAVTASVLSAAVTLTAVADYSPGNDVTLTYTDNDTNVGATLSGLSGGKLSGGDGLSLGAFTGVTGISSTDDTFLAAQAVISNRAAFHTTSANKAKNMCYAFGKMLSNALNWRNQQYITMPVVDDVATLGAADTLFDDKINFAIDDSEFGSRLALFAAGGKAIVSPYILKNLQINLQSQALSYISGNQPAYTKKQAALLEDELKKVIQSFIDLEWIDAGTIAITLVEDNFVASGSINVAEPKAFWRIFAEMRQTL